MDGAIEILFEPNFYLTRTFHGGVETTKNVRLPSIQQELICDERLAVSGCRSRNPHVRDNVLSHGDLRLDVSRDLHCEWRSGNITTEEFDVDSVDSRVLWGVGNIDGVVWPTTEDEFWARRT